MAGGEFQEMSSKCNMFLDPSGFSSEDITSPFNIPRTSSLAKAKRPSVSFAEGTRFSPKERRGSGQEVVTPLGHPRSKPKANWGVLMVSALQGQTAKPGEESRVEEGGTEGELHGQEADSEASERNDGTPSGGGAQDNTAGKCRGTYNTSTHKKCHTTASDSQATVLHKVTTVYVTVGKAGRPVTKAESSSEGPVQSMLRRLGSLQRQRDQSADRGTAKGAEGIAKPPRRKLGTRVNLWEQAEHPVGGVSKPVRRQKHTQNNCSETAEGDQTVPTDSECPKRPLSSILKSVPEVGPAQTGRGNEGRAEQGSAQGLSESSYLTVGPAGDALSEVITNDLHVGEEPCYENVMVKQ